MASRMDKSGTYLPFRQEAGALRDDIRLEVPSWFGVGREFREQVDKVERILQILQSECEGRVPEVSAWIPVKLIVRLE
jgi:hypothetical protein